MSIDWDALVLAPCAATFGEPVTYYPFARTPVDLVGIFNDRYRETKFEDGVQVDDYSTILSLRAAAVSAQPTQADFFRIRGILYAVTDVDPDGIGDLRVSLRSANDMEAARIRRPTA